VLTQMELGRISSQRHHSQLAAEYHLSALKLLQNCTLLSGKKKTGTAPKKRHLLYMCLFCKIIIYGSRLLLFFR